MDTLNFNFEKLDVYQRSLDLSFTVYRLTRKWSRLYLNNLIDQLIRATLSVCLNIAEGSSRSKKEFMRFLDIARGSCCECVPLIEIAYKEGLLDESTRNEIRQSLYDIARMLSGLKRSLSPNNERRTNN